jgi:hypothetical protein
MILLVILCVSLIFYIQILSTKSRNPTIQGLGSTFASILNAIQIQILNLF